MHAQPLWRGARGKGDGAHEEARPDTPLERAQKLESAVGRSTEASRLILSAAAPWSPRNHDLFPLRTRQFAYQLLLVGNRLASMRVNDSGTSRGLLDAWVDAVMPQLLTRGVSGDMLLH